MLGRAPSAEPVGSCVVVQPRPGVNGLPLTNAVTPLISQLSRTHLAGWTFSLVPGFGQGVHVVGYELLRAVEPGAAVVAGTRSEVPNFLRDIIAEDVRTKKYGDAVVQ